MTEIQQLSAEICGGTEGSVPHPQRRRQAGTDQQNEFSKINGISTAANGEPMHRRLECPIVPAKVPLKRNILKNPPTCHFCGVGRSLPGPVSQTPSFPRCCRCSRSSEESILSGFSEEVLRQTPGLRGHSLQRKQRYSRNNAQKRPLTYDVLRILLQARETLVVQGVLVQAGKSLVHRRLLGQRAQLTARIHKDYLIISVKACPKSCRVSLSCMETRPLPSYSGLQRLESQSPGMTFQA